MRSKKPSRAKLLAALRKRTRREAAHMYGVTYKTLWSWCKQYSIPNKGPGNTRLTEEEVAEIRAELLRGAGRELVCRRHGISTRALRRIEKGQTWRHVL